MMHRGFAPVRDGKLWIDSCKGETFSRYKIYESREVAETHCDAGDAVQEVHMILVGETPLIQELDSVKAELAEALRQRNALAEELEARDKGKGND